MLCKVQLIVLYDFYLCDNDMSLHPWGWGLSARLPALVKARAISPW